MSLELGLDEHEWLQYELIMEEVEADPDNTLVELVNLVEDMLEGRQLDTPDSETSRMIESARDIAARVEVGLAVPLQDVSGAIEELKTLFNQLSSA